MGLWRSFAGIVQIQITSADPSRALRDINAAGITVYDVMYADSLTVCGKLSLRDCDAVDKLLRRRGDKMEILERQGMYWSFRKLLSRPVLVGFLLLVLLLALFLPTRVFFINIEGNTTIPTNLILEKAQECGIRFGASRRAVRSEKMKNALISAIPELQWAGVNTSGCVATISVREKSLSEEETTKQHCVSSIVASRDGVIYSCTVVRGNLLCRAGQAVTAGQTLVSGYTDCGITIQATQAEAEIVARTLRDLEVITPSDAVFRGAETARQTKYSLRIGKKLINFYQDSGISDTTCVKMYEEDYWTLPGGFQLPVAWVTEQYIYYETSENEIIEESAFDWMKDAAQAYLQTQMVAGQIIGDDVSVGLYDGVFRLRGQYACLEMIGQVKSEEIINYNGKHE